MTDEKWLEISEYYKKEFPADMPLNRISEKMDTMNDYPDIQELRKILCNELVSALTEGFVKYDDKELIAYDGSLLKLVYENIEKLEKDRFFYWAFYYYLMKQYGKGEYGRQYIIPIGRLDLLCEDNVGNLYIIELKKDSGYDDAYKQIVEYLDWFEQNEKFKDKKIYGIICLNSPTQQLIDKVHADKRIKLFEYQISYTER